MNDRTETTPDARETRAPVSDPASTPNANGDPATDVMPAGGANARPSRSASGRTTSFQRGTPAPLPGADAEVSAPARTRQAPAPPRRAAAPAAPTPTPTPTDDRAADTRPAEPATTDRPGAGASDPAGGDATEGSGTSATGAPRKRRRRGGRGRGGGGARSTSEAGPTEDGSEAEAGSSDRPDVATPRRAAPSTRGPSAPRRRTTTTSSDSADAAAAALDDAPASDTPGSQRDDAQPDDPAATDAPRSSSSRRRRRGSRGGANRSAAADGEQRARAGSTAEVDVDAEGGDSTDEAPRRQGKPRSKEQSIEERVASGGPTRGIRQPRSRTGRDGRRRREPLVTPPRVTDKLMVITEHGDRDQIAVLEEDALVQHYVTRRGATSMVGNVYLGRVQNVLPGMEAAFVDIGRGRNGVLYAGEVNYSPEDLEGQPARIENILKPGQAVMVQVTKDPMGGKGARLTAQVSLPGRFLVFAPKQDVSGISRRLSEDSRKKLKTILKRLKPADDGVIVRTAAEGATEEAITHDLTRLIEQWSQIEKQANKVKAPAVLYEEPELTVRVVRDLFTDEEYKKLATDSPRIHEKVMAYVRDVAPDLEPKVELHQGPLPVFEEYRVVEQIHKALDKKVWLPSGGYLFIERTEAMTIIDVNTGKSVGKTNLEETVVNTNLEAAKEVARQLRLRDIGGIIVVDFIDMLLEKNKKQVEDTMRDALAIDKTRSQVFEIGPLGLMQVTRKRVSSGLVESFSETCPTCEGRGILINYES